MRSKLGAGAATGMVVHLMGALAVETGARRATERDLPGRQPRLTFAFLVSNRGRSIPHEELADLLWGDELPATWQPALRGLVSKVRSIFDLVGLDGASILSGDAGRYRLDLSHDTVIDVERATEQASEAAHVLHDGGVQTARRLAGQARSVLSRPLLPGIDSPWVDRRRNEIGLALNRCLEVLGECRLVEGEHDRAVHVIEELLHREPFREPAWRLLMRIHSDAGNIAEALRTYDRCRKLLGEELGTDPSPETRGIHASILRGSTLHELSQEDPRSVSRPAPPLAGPPYPGLRPFDEEDAELFFGRAMEVDTLIERLLGHRFVAVVGPSGSGKSSLVRAGLLPALQAGALPDADTWQHAVVVPGSTPLDAMASALLKLRFDDVVRAATDRLGYDEAALHDAASAVLRDQARSELLLLVVDQFEELFSLCRDEAERRRFVTCLLHATRRPDARVLVIITVRADFYGRAAAYPALAEAMSRSQVLVPPLEGDALQTAIEEPARLAGLRFEDGLVGRILADVTREPGALPLLQHSLRELYNRRADHVLTRGAYEDIGRVSGALAQRAEDIWSGFSPEQQRTVRRVMMRLIEPGVGTEATRRRVSTDELVTEPEVADAIDEVIAELVNARLLVTSADPATGRRTLEISHEALLNAWPRLIAWIDDDRAGLLIHRRLTDAAKTWEDRSRHPDYLLSGARLTEIESWVLEHEGDLNPLERGFLAASVEHEAAENRRRSKIRRLLTTGLVAGFVVMTTLTVLALGQRSRADRESDLARSRRLAAEATNQLELDPQLALILAVEAHEIAPTTQADAALRGALARSALRHRLSTPDPETAVAVSPDGRMIASWGLSSSAIWDTASGKRIADLAGVPRGSPGGWAVGLTFSPDGRRLLATDLDGSAWIWETRPVRLMHELSWPSTGTVVATSSEANAGWSPDGSLVLVAGVDGRARLFDAETGRPRAEIPAAGPSPGLARARFSPDGRHVAVAGAAGLVAIVDTDTGARVHELLGHEGAVHSLEFAADGTVLVTAGEDGTARTWDVESGRPRHVLEDEKAIRIATISDDGRLVLTGDAAGDGVIWDTGTGDRLFDLAGHDQRLIQVRFDDTGTLALTASADGTTRIWDSTTGEEVTVLLGSREPITDAEILPDGRTVVTSGDDARIWRLPSRAVSVIDAHDAPALLRVDADARRMVTMGWAEGRARVWDLQTERSLATLAGVPGTTSAADISPDGTLVVTTPFDPTPGVARDDDQPLVWDVETGNVVTQLAIPSDDPRGVCGGSCGPTVPVFSPDGDRVAVGSDDGRIRVFDPRTGEQVFTTSFGPARHIDWSPDGRHLLGFDMVGWPKPLVIYDATSGEITHEASVPQGLSFGFASFDPSGRLVGTTAGSIARVHDLSKGIVVAELRLRGIAIDMSFSPDGTLLVTASAAGAELWDLASQRRLAILSGSAGAHSAVFTPNGRRIVVGGGDGTVRIHDCEVCQPLDALLELAADRVTRDLTEAERARFLTD